MQKQITAALQDGDVVDALRAARAYVQDSPHDPQAHRLLSLALASNGETAAAHASLEHAIMLSPHDGSLHYLRAVLLFLEQRREEMHAALERSTEVDPNELRAYLLQAQLSLAQADLDEAERLTRLAARIDPEHPWLLTTQGLIRLHRGDYRNAQALLQRAVRRAPQDLQARYALGLSFLAQGHDAFAEQIFRTLVNEQPRNHSLRFQLVQALRRQNRFSEAAQTIEDGAVADPDISHDLLRFAGELWLVAGDHARALGPLRRAVAAEPDNRAALDALIEALRRQGDAPDARHTLDAALAAAPHIEGLWSARLSFEPADGDIGGIADRWEQALPGSPHPLHVQMWVAARSGDQPAAMDLARRIVAIEPGHYEAQTVIIDQLYLNDPQAAVAHIEALLPRIQDPQMLRRVLSWLARAQDRAGRFDQAVRSWERLDSIPDPQGLPLPAASSDAHITNESLAAPGSGHSEQRTDVVFVYGPPGSGVEAVMETIAHGLKEAAVLRDRLGTKPPADPLQFPESAPQIADGQLTSADFAAAWRAMLPARSSAEGALFVEWLPWWDNALLRVLRREIPRSRVLLVIADPRDMLLDWLQRGTYIRYSIESCEAAARFLLAQVEQLIHLSDHDLIAHAWLHTDMIAEDPQELAGAVSAALELQCAPAPALAPGRFPSGHWRNYAEALAKPFALLTAVAVRLGYAEK